MSEQDREQAFVASGGVESSVSAAHAPDNAASAWLWLFNCGYGFPKMRNAWGQRRG